MKKNIQTIINTSKLKFQNKIKSKNQNFILSAIYKLIHLQKRNLIWHKNVQKA